MCWCASCHLHGHPRCAVVRSLTLCSSPCSLPCVSPFSCFSTWTLSWTSSWPSSGQYPTGTPPNEESGPLAENAPLTFHAYLLVCSALAIYGDMCISIESWINAEVLHAEIKSFRRRHSSISHLWGCRSTLKDSSWHSAWRERQNNQVCRKSVSRTKERAWRTGYSSVKWLDLNRGIWTRTIRSTIWGLQFNTKCVYMCVTKCVHMCVTQVNLIWHSGSSEFGEKLRRLSKIWICGQRGRHQNPKCPASFQMAYRSILELDTHTSEDHLRAAIQHQTQVNNWEACLERSFAIAKYESVAREAEEHAASFQMAYRSLSTRSKERSSSKREETPGHQPLFFSIYGEPLSPKSEILSIKARRGRGEEVHVLEGLYIMHLEKEERIRGTLALYLQDQERWRQKLLQAEKDGERITWSKNKETRHMAQRERLQDGGEAANHAKGKGGVKQRDCLQRTCKGCSFEHDDAKRKQRNFALEQEGKGKHGRSRERSPSRRPRRDPSTGKRNCPTRGKSLSGRAETLFVTNPMQNDVKKARIVTVGFFCLAYFYRRGHSTVGKPTSYARRWTSIRRKYQTLHGRHVRCPGGNPCTTEGTLRQRDAVHPGLIGNQARTGTEAEVASRAAALLSDFQFDLQPYEQNTEHSVCQLFSPHWWSRWSHKLNTNSQPNFFDNDHISETTEIFIQEFSSDSRPSNLHDVEYDDYTIGMALSSPLFTQEREDAASRRQAYHSPDESLLSSQSLSVGHVRTERLVNEFGSLSSNVRENPCRGSENEQIRILLERQREHILADYQAEIQKHEFQADYDRRSIQKLNEVIESQKRRN